MKVQGGDPWSDTLNNVLGNLQFSVLVVIGDGLDQSANLAFAWHACRHANNSPLIDEFKLLLEFGAMLISVSIVGLSLIAYFLTHILG